MTAEYDITKTTTSDLANAQDDYSVDPKTTDGVTDTQETEWQIDEWSKWFGYYVEIAELRGAIDAKATWTVGKGYLADEQTTRILDAVKGWGKDTFNTILENMIRTYHICGDSFAEIIVDEKGYLANLKPLDPSTIKIIVNKAGRIIRYEQMSKSKEIKKPVAIFPPEKIFHLSRNRTADEIHGRGVPEQCEGIILFRNETLADWQKVLHRNVAPIIIWHMATDDQTEINAFSTKLGDSKKVMEHLLIPKGAVVPEVLSVAPNATMNPLPTIEMLNNSFYQAVGIPQIIVGGSGGFTEAAVKIAYLGFQQITEKEQLFLEENILLQLNLEIELEFPVSLENEALSDKPKQIGGDSAQAQSPTLQKESANENNDTIAEGEGKK